MERAFVGGWALRDAVLAVGYVNLFAFTALAVIAIRHWRVRRDSAALWVALGFGALGLVVLLGRIVPMHPHSFGERALQRVEIAVLVLFPYLLYRFTRAFAVSSHRLALFVGSMTSLLVVWTFALPSIPATGEARPWWFNAYLGAFLFHWAALSTVVAVRLWRSGRRHPHVARRRMQMLAFASAALTAALLLVAINGGQFSATALATGLLGTVSALTFLLGLAPPPLVRMIWRRHEQRRVQDAISALMALAENEREIAARVLGPMSDIVGARAVAIRGADGELLGAHNLDDAGLQALEQGQALDDGETGVVELQLPRGSVVVWTTPYAPFFGEEELKLLETLGALTAVALDRARLFARERETRLSLEQANRMKEDFIALAAHELRTPMTTIHGVALTLTSRGDQLTAEQRELLEEQLVRQTSRMVTLVEQLLDLSRIDAEAVPIAPRRVDVRERLVEVVKTAAAGRDEDVLLDVAPGLEAVIDPNALERIVSNLIVNAFRYGAPPVVVSAEQRDRHFRVAVADQGAGVPPEFVPDLFERFTRSASGAPTGGSGLGLAIARSYAQAHRGDLLYRQGEQGAHFELVLPVEAVEPRAT